MRSQTYWSKFSKGETIGYPQGDMRPSSSNSSGQNHVQRIVRKRNSIRQLEVMVTASAAAGYAPNTQNVDETADKENETIETENEEGISRNWRIRKLFNGSQLITLHKDIRTCRRPQTTAGRSYPDCTSTQAKLYGKNRRIMQQYYNRQSVHRHNGFFRQKSEQWARVSVASTSMYPPQMSYNQYNHAMPYGRTYCMNPMNNVYDRLYDLPSHNNFVAPNIPKKKKKKKNKGAKLKNQQTQGHINSSIGTNAVQNGGPSTSQNNKRTNFNETRKKRKARQSQQVLQANSDKTSQIKREF